MTAREVVRKLVALGAITLRQSGSHRVFRSADCAVHECQTSVPMHRGDLGTGLLRAIERDMEHCYGKGWLR